jgi:zinc protease
VIPKELEKKARHYYYLLPTGTTSETKIPPAIKSSETDLTLVKGPFEATGVHIGIPLVVTRKHSDFPSLFLASTAFGKHRSFVGRLMREVRELRGLNYGAYSYVEDFPDGGQSLIEPTQAARSRQAFTVWGRPSSLENGCFLTRQLVREVRSLGETGLSDAEFSLGQSHLAGNIPLLATGIDRALGYAMDSRFYRLQGDYLKLLQARVIALRRPKVNLLLAKYLRNVPMHLVVVTKDPEAFRKELTSKQCAIHYAEGISKP